MGDKKLYFWVKVKLLFNMLPYFYCEFLFRTLLKTASYTFFFYASFYIENVVRSILSNYW